MKTRNKVFLLGSVGKDPEIRSTGSATLVATFSLATAHRYKDQTGNWTEQADWHNIKVFGRTAEVVRDYLKKGDPVDVEGRITQETWEKDGQKHYKTVIIADSIILLGGGQRQTRDHSATGTRQVSATNPAPAVEQVFPEADESDVPF